ncbi:hypothetical protein [Micromonospora sp. WMMD980]|uniref:hypothetical protein n=1 Tax=Micromonospora sp. WMMD980 TaxID=3016088 RepID=UPI0024174FC3|nr:hypothetical protein [Micromonospora sp. WMMD980]MDG4799889.1 hypothetical protein [Micromonospora sp. WMMD980]
MRTTVPDPAARRPAGRMAAAAAAHALVAPLAACRSGGDGGPPTINLYDPPEQNLQKVVDDCNAQAQGRYRISYRVLPRQADGRPPQGAAPDEGPGP